MPKATAGESQLSYATTPPGWTLRLHWVWRRENAKLALAFIRHTLRGGPAREPKPEPDLWACEGCGGELFDRDNWVCRHCGWDPLNRVTSPTHGLVMCNDCGRTHPPFG